MCCRNTHTQSLLSFHLRICLGSDCLLVCLFVYVFWFFETGFLCSPGCSGTHFVDQAGLELRNLPASASQVLGLKECATMPGLNREFITEESWVDKKHLKKSSLVSREIKIKMTLKLYFTSIRMAKIKNSGDSTCWWGCGEEKTLLLVGWQICITTLEIKLEVP